MGCEFGRRFKQEIFSSNIVPLIGVYDVFSASIAAKYYSSIFVSGFGFAASFYGLPDIGFIAWSDMVGFVQRLRTILPNHHIIVDMDDGYGDPDIAAHVTALLAASGASGIVIEDQKRPRKCGHFDGKELMQIDDYLHKLERVLDVRNGMFVIARTDATDPEDIARRAKSFADAGADAVLVDAIQNFGLIKDLKKNVNKPLVFNQIAGGKSPAYTLEELVQEGISLVIYSTPCLFPAQAAVENAMISLKQNGGLIPTYGSEQVDLKICVELLNKNQGGRDPIGPGSSI